MIALADRTPRTLDRGPNAAGVLEPWGTAQVFRFLGCSERHLRTLRTGTERPFPAPLGTPRLAWWPADDTHRRVSSGRASWSLYRLSIAHLADELRTAGLEIPDGTEVLLQAGTRTTRFDGTKISYGHAGSDWSRCHLRLPLPASKPSARSGARWGTPSRPSPGGSVPPASPHMAPNTVRVDESADSLAESFVLSRIDQIDRAGVERRAPTDPPSPSRQPSIPAADSRPVTVATSSRKRRSASSWNLGISTSSSCSTATTRPSELSRRSQDLTWSGSTPRPSASIVTVIDGLVANRRSRWASRCRATSTAA